MINLILCGGAGTRLWPMSRAFLPKQFVPLFDEHSLFQKTLLRNQSVCEQFLIVSNQEHYFLALDQIQALTATQCTPFKTRFILEPVARNTAPAIALACLAVDPDAVLLVTPADHLIKDLTAYQVATAHAKTLAEQGKLVTLGIQPTSAETGFGYIETAQTSCTDELKALSFREKPDRAQAERYLQQDNVYWNSGIFCFKAGVFLAELETHAPNIYQACLNAYAQTIQDELLRIPTEAMQAIPADSIDYAIMEHSRQISVIPCDFGWSDLGSFEAIDHALPKDKSGNTHCENALLLDSKNNLVIGQQRTLVLIDLEEMMIIDSEDALLIAPKGSGQKIKHAVALLQQTSSPLLQTHRTVHRHWGTYTVLETAEKYKIKRLIVQPGKALSLQKHQRRSEHWVVVSGTATVTMGEKEFQVHPNESTYIPIGQKHRLANQGTTELVLIEAQVGDYTEEDDIIRFDNPF